MPADFAIQPPSGSGWAHELKHDGYRLQIHIRAGRVARALIKKASRDPDALLTWERATKLQSMLATSREACRKPALMRDRRERFIDASGAYAALGGTLKNLSATLGHSSSRDEEWSRLPRLQPK